MIKCLQYRGYSNSTKSDFTLRKSDEAGKSCTYTEVQRPQRASHIQTSHRLHTHTMTQVSIQSRLSWTQVFVCPVNSHHAPAAVPGSTMLSDHHRVVECVSKFINRERGYLWKQTRVFCEYQPFTCVPISNDLQSDQWSYKDTVTGVFWGRANQAPYLGQGNWASFTRKIIQAILFGGWVSKTAGRLLLCNDQSPVTVGPFWHTEA